MSQKIGASCWRYKHFRGPVLSESKDRKITTSSHSDCWALLISTSYNNSLIYWILQYEFSLNIFWIWYYLLSSSRQPTLSVIRLSKIFILLGGIQQLLLWTNCYLLLTTYHPWFSHTQGPRLMRIHTVRYITSARFGNYPQIFT